MKTLRTICLALVALAIIKVVAVAGDAKAKTVAIKDPTAIYKSGEVQLTALAFTDTDDFRNFDSGGGVALSYWASENVGLGFEAKTLDTDHAFFDTLGLNVAYRLPLEGGLAPFARLGSDWNAEASSDSQTRSEFDLYVGAGIEKRFKHGISISAEARIIRDYEFERDERFQFLAGLSKSF